MATHDAWVEGGPAEVLRELAKLASEHDTPDDLSDLPKERLMEIAGMLSLAQHNLNAMRVVVLTTMRLRYHLIPVSAALRLKEQNPLPPPIGT